MGMGVAIWAIVDAILNFVMFILVAVGVGIGGPHLWTLLVILADILLIIGALKSNSGLCVFWQVIMMIQIVLFFICWLLLPILVS